MVESTADKTEQKLVHHTLHSIREKCTVIEVKSIDTDVLILLLAPKWYHIVHVINRIGIDICKALSFFYCFTGCDTNSSFYGKIKCSFFDAWMKSERKDNLTKIFFRLGHMLESIESVDVFSVESLVKDVYFGTSHDKTKSLNSLRKHQFVQSTSNDLKKLAPSSDSLYMQILRASHIAGFEWLECAQNVLVPDPFLRGFIQKGGVYVRHWLPSPPTFDLKGLI